MATMVNQVMNMKDSRWLTLEVCREFQRNKCTRPETECKFAHPPQHVEVQNGRVTACFDSIKGKCQRKDPPCKYLHPPQHLREQLLQNGRNNLILKNLQWQAAHASAGGLVPGMVSPGVVPTTIMYEAGGKAVAFSSVLPGQYPVVSHPYLGTVPSSPVPYPWPGSAGAIQMTAVPGATEPTALINHQYPGVVPMSYPANPVQQKIAGRADRLEGAIPGVSYKRMAVADSKSGIPMYQPGYQQVYQQAVMAMQMQQQQPYIPVSYAGHPPTVPRF